jgi:hypothetical protein
MWNYDYPLMMGANGLYSDAFGKKKAEDDANDLASLDNFGKLHVDADVRIRIRQGGEHSVRFAEGEDQRDIVQFDQQGDQLNIRTSEDANGAVLLEITLPNISELHLSNSGSVTLEGLDLGSFRLVNEGSGPVKADGNFNSISVELRGDNSLDLSGNCNHLTALLENEARLDAGKLAVRVADISASNDCWAKISPADTLLQHLDESSDLVAKLKTSVVIEK